MVMGTIPLSRCEAVPGPCPVPTDPGKAFVHFYYEVGPSLAAAIEDKPIACLLSGFYYAGGRDCLPGPLLAGPDPRDPSSVLGACPPDPRGASAAIVALDTQLQGQRGAMLVTLIAAMVVFAALGAVMIGMFGTSALSQVAETTR